MSYLFIPVNHPFSVIPQKWQTAVVEEILVKHFSF